VWRERAAGGDGAVAGVAALALTAAAIEAASMLPYLAAIGIISSSDLSPSSSVVVLATYCLVMIAPALLLLAARVTMRERLTPTLARLDGWLSRNSGEALAWVLAIIGVHLAVNAAHALGWLS
jgi:CHASE1-domain containing sensor protein